MEDLVTVVIRMYSNYDCCNSFDEYDDMGYLYEVHQPIKDAVLKEDFMYEFRNGAYGGSLFCFVFRMTYDQYEDMSNEMVDRIFIPKGTQFGFYSDTAGSSSTFEMKTVDDINLPIQYGDTEHDRFNISLDGDRGIYSLESIFGDTSWIDEITLKEEVV